jgi:hypothetical protein
MTVQMQRMDVAAIVVERQPVAFALLQPKLFNIPKGFPIDRPMIEILTVPKGSHGASRAGFAAWRESLPPRPGFKVGTSHLPAV